VHWVDVLNEACAKLRREAWEGERAELRARALDRLKEQARFPLNAQFKGYVVRERVLKMPRLQASIAGQRTEGESPYLELVPERFGQDAYSLVGGVLVPYERRLQPGSVLQCTVDLLDPTSYRLNPPGLLSELHKAQVVVAVEA
jgi:hypothetical protein